MGDRDRGRHEKPRGDRDRQREREPPPKHPLVRMAEKVTDLMDRDERVGFPRYRPHVDKPETFGWLFAAQKILLHHIMREDTRVVVQIGAYLGKTTLFIRERSPNAVIFVLDEWDNKKLQEEEAFNKNYENIVLFEEVPFYEMFLYNLWDHQAKVGADGRMTGVVPLRMSWREGFKLLVSLGVRPDALYWEGFPLTQKEVEDLLEACVKNFPGVSILGDGFQVKEVREGILAKKHTLFRGHRPYVELGKCWTYARIREHQLSEPRELYYLNSENKAEQSALAVEGEVEEEKEGTTVKKKVALGSLGFADLLSSFKTTSTAKREEEAQERARKREAEEKEAERVRRMKEREEERRREKEEEEERRKRSRSRSNDRNGGRKRSRSRERAGGSSKKGKKAKETEEGGGVEEEVVVPQPVVPSLGLLPTPSKEEVAVAMARKRQAEQARLQHERALQEQEGRGWFGMEEG